MQTAVEEEWKASIQVIYCYPQGADSLSVFKGLLYSY